MKSAASMSDSTGEELNIVMPRFSRTAHCPIVSPWSMVMIIGLFVCRHVPTIPVLIVEITNNQSISNVRRGDHS